MSNANRTNTMEEDNLIESLIRLYTTNTSSPAPVPQRHTTRSNNYPLSFNAQLPRQTRFSRPQEQPTQIPASTSQIHNQQYSIYLSAIQTIRDIGTQYNNNMREYNTNIRQILTTLNELQQDIRTLHSERETANNRPETQIPRQENSRFYDGVFMQPNTSTRPNQNSSYRNTPLPNQATNNIFDILMQAIPLTTTMENVVVRPSQEQISNATRSIIYNSNNSRINSNACPITLEPFEEQQMLTQITYCGHVFSQDGINRWFEGNVRCPVCRYDIRNYNARCRQCRRPLEEYGTRCTYCEEAGNTEEQDPDEEENMDTEGNSESPQIPETDHEDDSSELPMDSSSNPYQVILNYEIRAPDFVFNSTDMSFNLST